MKTIASANALDATRRLAPLLGAVVLAVAPAAFANHASAVVTPDCDGFTIEVYGATAYPGAARVEYELGLVPQAGPSLSISGVVPIAYFDSNYPEFGVHPKGDYALSGISILVTGNQYWSTEPIDFWPPSLSCPCGGSIGDLVWLDANANGLQDVGEVGISGVPVELRAGTGTGGALLQSTVTNEHGLSLFTGLCAGDYTVIVVTPPPGLSASPCHVGSNRAIDDNCSPAPVTLPTDTSTDLTIDFGYFPPPPAAEWASCKGKLQQFSLIWPATMGTITIDGITNDAPGGVVTPGQRVTFMGPFAVNDLSLGITGDSRGRSTFHVSCSDADMDGRTSTNLEQQQLPGRAQDCGKFEGNGKALSGTWITDWCLDGLIDAEGKTLACTQTSEASSSCELELGPPPWRGRPFRAGAHSSVSSGREGLARGRLRTTRRRPVRSSRSRAGWGSCCRRASSTARG